ncbi:MAG: peptide ABC transporter substrate-binding protein [Planctomycetota bacterium]|jgi:oligopeptide transport system substrate-binding protein
MTREGRRVVAVLGLAGVVLLAALSLGGRALVGRADLAFCNQNEIASLDPAVASGVPEGRILQALYEGLVRSDPVTGAPSPALASRWEVSPDGLLWTFHVRTDSRWSDDSPITARDAAWSLRRFLAPDTGAPYADLLWCIDGAAAYTSWDSEARGPPPPPDRAALGIEATAEDRLELRLVQPTPHLPSILAMPPLGIVQRACVERWGALWVKPGHVVTGGPFRLAERRIRDRMRLVRHEGYWGRDEVALGTVDAYAADGITTQLNMYLTGQVDWMIKPPTSLYEVIFARPDVRTGPQAGATFFRFNLTRPPLDDPRVRAALTLALDRTMLARDVMRGGELPAMSYVPTGLPGYQPAVLRPADPERARALLAEAGFPGGNGFPDLELLYPHNELTRDFCEAVASQWERELGLRPRLVNQAWKVFLDSSRRLQYDVGWGAWTGDYLDATSFLDIFRSRSGNNRTGWANETYDGLLDRAAHTQDPAARAALLAEAEAVLLDELPIAPVYQRINLNLVAPRVGGFHDNALDVHPLRDMHVTGPPP